MAQGGRAAYLRRVLQIHTFVYTQIILVSAHTAYTAHTAHTAHTGARVTAFSFHLDETTTAEDTEPGFRSVEQRPSVLWIAAAPCREKAQERGG